MGRVSFLLPTHSVKAVKQWIYVALETPPLWKHYNKLQRFKATLTFMPSNWHAQLWLSPAPLKSSDMLALYKLDYYYFFKASRQKYWSKQCNTVAMVLHSVIMVVQKETAFPHWRAMERRWNKVVSLVSSVTVVMRLSISCVNSMAISCHISTASTTQG